MRPLEKTIRLFQRRTIALLRDERGSTMIFMGLAMFMLLAATGVSVDMARAQILQQKMSSSLDAAGLAAGATANVINAQTQATKYFNANFPSGYLGAGSVTLITSCADISGNSVTCTSPSVNTINLNASTTQPTAILSTIGIYHVTVAAASQITRATSGMELALVLDNTGSMGNPVNSSNSNVSKITALKCALAGDAAFGGGSTCENNSLVTSGLLDILFGNSDTLNDLYVSVVPFSDMVNLKIKSTPGSTFVNNVTGGNKASMGNCLDTRNGTTNSTNDAGITLPSGDHLTLDIADDIPSSFYFKALPSSGNSYCPPAAVQPMTTSKSTAIATIENMSPNGDTMLQLGLAWGWRTLSPSWSGLWGATPTFTYPQTSTTIPLPLPYNTSQMKKVVVFMTDGMNNSGSSSVSTNTNSNTNSGYDDQATFPTDNQMDQLTEDVCDAMKANGVIIYTIGFGSLGSHSPPTITDRTGNNTYVDAPLLQYCATQVYAGDTSHFFLAPTNAQLESAFQQIGDQLANLRVSQ